MNITLTAGTGLVTGGIGTPGNFLEINVGTGVLNAFDRLAATTSGIFLTETIGDLRVDTVWTRGDVSLTTVAGSIIDARNGRRRATSSARASTSTPTAPARASATGGQRPRDRVLARRRRRRRPGGGGEHLRDRDPRHAAPRARRGARRRRPDHGPRDRDAHARRPPRRVVHGPGHLQRRHAHARRQLRRRAVPGRHDAADHRRDAVRRRLHDRLGDRHDDHADARRWRSTDDAAHRRDADRPGHARRGPRPAARRRGALRRERAAHRPARPRRGARGSVLLRVGDDVTTTPNSEIVAGRDIDIYGDWTNGDPHFGTTMVLRGTITPGAGFAHPRLGPDRRRHASSSATRAASRARTTLDSPGYIQLGGTDARLRRRAARTSSPSSTCRR